VSSSLLGFLGGKGSLGGTADLTGSAGSNETCLLTSGGVSGHSRGVTDVLLVTTTVRMVDGVHGDTTDTGPSVSLCLVLPEGIAGLKEGLVGSLATGNDADHGSAVTLDGLTDAGGEADSGLLAVVGVADDDGGGSGGSGEGGAVTVLGLAVGDNGTLGKGVDGKDVSDGEGSCAIKRKNIPLEPA